MGNYDNYFSEKASTYLQKTDKNERIIDEEKTIAHNKIEKSQSAIYTKETFNLLEDNENNDDDNKVKKNVS